MNDNDPRLSDSDQELIRTLRKISNAANVHSINSDIGRVKLYSDCLVMYKKWNDEAKIKEMEEQLKMHRKNMINIIEQALKQT